MELKAWIKLYRKELEWGQTLSDQEWRYYTSARMIAVWDKPERLLGTFDARIKVFKKEVLPDWATGKICEVKKSLIKKGLLQKHPGDSRRLYITNAHIWYKKGKRYEDMIQNAETNLHNSELNVLSIEDVKASLEKGRTEIIRKFKC